MDPDAKSAIDDRIVAALVEDGRMSLADLGSRIGLSAHAAGARLRRLLADGVILGFTAVVGEGAQEPAYEAMIDVRLAPSTPPERFEAFVQTIVGMEDAWFVTGRYDFVLRLRCRSAQELDHAVRAVRQGGGVAATETRIVMRARSRQRNWAAYRW